MDQHPPDRITYVSAASSWVSRDVAWRLGQLLAEENEYGADPVPAPDEWGWSGDPGAWVAVLNDGYKAIGLIVVEQAVEVTFWDGSELAADPEWHPWSGPLMTFLWISPEYRGTGHFRHFYAEVVEAMGVAPAGIAHLPPFTPDALRFHRRLNASVIRVGRNHGRGAPLVADRSLMEQAE